MATAIVRRASSIVVTHPLGASHLFLTPLKEHQGRALPTSYHLAQRSDRQRLETADPSREYTLQLATAASRWATHTALSSAFSFNGSSLALRGDESRSEVISPARCVHQEEGRVQPLLKRPAESKYRADVVIVSTKAHGQRTSHNLVARPTTRAAQYRIQKSFAPDRSTPRIKKSVRIDMSSLPGRRWES